MSRDPWGAMVNAIVDLPPAPPGPAKFNPRPPGVIRPGGTSDLVLTFLRARPDRFLPHHEITEGVGRSKVAVDWALGFLRRGGHVDVVVDGSRNSRYFRYRARPAGADSGRTDRV